MLVISNFEFAKINLSKGDVEVARFYGLNVGFEKAKDEFLMRLDYEQI